MLDKGNKTEQDNFIVLEVKQQNREKTKIQIKNIKKSHLSGQTKDGIDESESMSVNMPFQIEINLNNTILPSASIQECPELN